MRWLIELADGRTLSVPLTWYPRLWHGTSEERIRWRLIGDRTGYPWPDLDEDISVEGLLEGRPRESQRVAEGMARRTPGVEGPSVTNVDSAQSWVRSITPAATAPGSTPS